MELRQLRYFAKVVEMTSLGRAALELGVSTSALSQQVSRLEDEIATRLLYRTSTGVTPTAAGLAFLHHAQLTLRQADHAVQAAQRGRMHGFVSVGLPPTTARVLAMPLIHALRERYPDIQLHIVEMLSGYLASQLTARQLDMAVLFQTDLAHRWKALPLLDEAVTLLHAPGFPGIAAGDCLSLAQVGDIPLILPSAQHGLRSTLNVAFDAAGMRMNVVMEIDGLVTLMDAVRSGVAATLQPGSAAARSADAGLCVVRIRDSNLNRRNYLCSLAEEELSPAALAVRVVMRDVMRQLVQNGEWPGATLAMGV